MLGVAFVIQRAPRPRLPAASPAPTTGRSNPRPRPRSPRRARGRCSASPCPASPPPAQTRRQSADAGPAAAAERSLLRGAARCAASPSRGSLPRAAGVASPDSSTALPPPPVSVPAFAAQGRSKIGHTAVAQAPVLPAPAPYVDDVAAARGARVGATKGGVPIAVVVALIAGLVLVGGTIIFVLKPAPKPMSAQPRLDPQGNEVLHLKCEDCADGTVVTLETSKATFKAKEAELPLTKPLEVGENNLRLKIDRPGSGRDEEVKLVVPLGFFIRPDLADIGAKPPVITVRVAAAPGTEVKVDGKQLALDASGKGSYAVDVSSDTEGPTEELRVIDRKIPYTVTMKGDKTPQAGVVSARIAVLPLRIDAPSAHAVIDTASFAIAGQTVAGGTVAIDGQPAPTQPDGSYADTRTATPAGGETSLEVRATVQGRAPRTVHVTVKRVASLDVEAKAAELTPLVTYDQIAPDVTSKVGAHAVIAGEVVESRVTGHQTIALVNDTRGCKSGPCLARVIGSEDAKLARGTTVSAYGIVTRAVTTASGKTVPELSADFVVRGKR